LYPFLKNSGNLNRQLGGSGENQRKPKQNSKSGSTKGEKLKKWSHFMLQRTFCGSEEEGLV